jgi:tetratricopeptide (TPR) repeat protein
LKPAFAPALLVLGGCVYFNAMYDANRAYDAGVDSLQEQSEITARIEFDSVIAKTGRIVEDHPDSKYADDAAILKTRAELNNEMWESAVETSIRAEELADTPKMRAVALGLRGVAWQELGAYGEADSLLSLGLAADVDADDEALFLFQRGLARQRLGMADLATSDLEAAANSVELSREGSLTLSIALREIGEYGRSAELAGRLLTEANPNPQSPLYLHVDSLAVLSPFLVDSMASALLEDGTAPATRRAAYHYLAGRALVEAGREAEALAAFDRAAEEAATSQAASDAAYYAIEIRLRAAVRPSDVTALLGRFSAAQRSGRREMREQAVRWETGALDFEGLVTAYESRGASAAEAVLRAAEIARIDLGSPALARGSYLLYLELVPDSRWAAKAVYGALSVSGHPPDPDWVVDRGLETDDELRALLDGLPPDDPYRLAVSAGADRGPMADSMYVLAEADLRRRLFEIRMLFDPTAADTVPDDEEAPVESDEDEIQN